MERFPIRSLQCLFIRSTRFRRKNYIGSRSKYAGLTGNETVWDLYCGIGTISLFLAKKAKRVFGVEIVPDAVRDAKKNAQRNRIANAEFFVGKAEEILPEKYEREGVKADVIVVDPPRKGCDQKLLEDDGQDAAGENRVRQLRQRNPGERPEMGCAREGMS